MLALVVLLSSCTNPRKSDSGTGTTMETKTWTTETTTSGAMTEEEFNNSGQAKAIENETDLWQVYENKEVWFSFKYPTGTNLIKEENYKLDQKLSYIKVEVKDIGNPVAPNDLTKEQDMKNIEDLSAWKFWVYFDNSLKESEKVVSVWNIFGQDLMVVSRFEVCNVTVERMLIFYFNNKKILITAYAPTDTLKVSYPDYFMLDSENCQTETRWKFDKQAEFYQSLVDNKWISDIQLWYNDFDKMIWTVIFDHK